MGGSSGEGARGWRDVRRVPERLEEGAGKGEEGGEGESCGGHSFLRLFSPGSMMISQLLLLSQNLPCKKDSVKTAAMAAKDCVIREN